MHEYTGGYIGALCVFFSLGALVGATLALIITAFWLDDEDNKKGRRDRE